MERDCMEFDVLIVGAGRRACLLPVASNSWQWKKTKKFQFVL